VDALRDAGVARVVLGSLDPQERGRGQGVRLLVEAGIEVAIADGPDEYACRDMNGPFMTWSVTGRPEVTLKMAQSLDGRVATSAGESQWITGEDSRAVVHRWRADSDAVAVGVGTAIADDPQLTARGIDERFRAPIRVVFDSEARTPVEGTLASAGEGVIVVASDRAPADRVAALEATGVEVIAFGGDRRERLNHAVDELGRREVQSILIEGGPTLAAGVLAAGAVDRVAWMVAPILIGGDGAPALDGPGHAKLADAWRLGSLQTTRLGNDALIVGRLRELPGGP
jgi:diaminohydroxyphosphoribosylaminopyrimidine deaminase/5-amino-6-(5-phosphoribosylamino)uracil reductase